MENTTDTGLKKPTKKWLKKRTQIINVASEIFAIKGYESTSLKDIADRLDMQRPSLQYYFKDKADLIDNVIYEITLEISNRYDIAAVSKPKENKIDVLSSIWAEYFLSNPASAKILLRQAIDPQFPRSEKNTPIVESLLSVVNKEEGEAARDQSAFHSFAAIFFSAAWVAIRDATFRSTGYDLLSREGQAFMRSIVERINIEHS